MTQRYWLIEDRLCTSQELRTAGISPLRCVDLGRCESVDAAMVKARKKFGKPQELVAARNVRIAVDSGNGARFGLSKEQIERLRAGEILSFDDSLGRFQIGWSTRDEN